MKFPRTPRNSETYHLLWNFLSTADLGSLIGFWQCKFHSVEYLAIFLPLWFYVKSILAHFRRSKTAVWTILKTLNSNFWKNYTLENVKSSPKFIAAQMAKLAVFGALKWPKLISRKVWAAEKSWNFDIDLTKKILSGNGIRKISLTLNKVNLEISKSFKT